jgi:RNA polymerase sigma-70 factor (sigma-E family)
MFGAVAVLVYNLFGVVGVLEVVVVGLTGGRVALPEGGGVAAGLGADVLVGLYARHYAALVRTAALLLDEPDLCEEVVQEGFVRVFASRRRLRDPDKAVAYLRRTVVNLCRSSLRRRLVAARHLSMTMMAEARPDDDVMAAIDRDALVRALRRLAPRARQAVVLRFYVDLSEIETATAMGVSVGAVKSYTSRGLAALAELLREQP